MGPAARERSVCPAGPPKSYSADGFQHPRYTTLSTLAGFHEPVVKRVSSVRHSLSSDGKGNKVMPGKMGCWFGDSRRPALSRATTR